MDSALLLRGAEILVRQAVGVLLAPLLGEDEDAGRQQVGLPQVLHQVDPQVLVLRGGGKATRPSGPAHVTGSMTCARRTTSAPLLCRAAAPASSLLITAARSAPNSAPLVSASPTRTRLDGPGLVAALQRGIGVLPSLLDKLLVGVDDLVDRLAGPEVVLQRNGPLGSGYDVDVLLLGPANPRREVVRVGDRGGQQDE